jgi:ATP-dependent protease HslVU (ClpYQ) ATPase subunit
MGEQTFFKDEAIDRLLGVVLQLAGEVYILKDRQQALEKLLAEKGIIFADEIENTAAKIDANERDAFISRILEPILQGSLASSNVDEEFQLK